MICLSWIFNKEK